MRYTNFIIKKYKGIEENNDTPKLEIKIQKGKAAALIGENECGKSTILKGIYCFDYRNDEQNKQYKHLDVLKNRNSTSSDNATIQAELTSETGDYAFILEYFNEALLFLKNSSVERNEVNGELQENIVEAEKSDDEKIAVISKAFKKFSIARQILKKDGTIESTYSIIFEQDISDSFFSNVIGEKFKTKQDDLCKLIIKKMPHMLYITDLPDFYSVNTFDGTQGTDKREQCKKIINNLFISGTENSLTVEKVFDIAAKDEADFYTTIKGIERYLNEEFTSRWNQFKLNKSFGQLKIKIESNPSSKKLNIQVAESCGGKEYYYPIDERSMGFQWFFKFVMNIAFNPLKDNGIIFLIDEPGTFLHESAQVALAKELNNILRNNYMLFSTHCYSMLNLKEVELNRIYVVERGTKSITATKATDYQGYSDESKKSPILPILNSLRKTIIDYIKENEKKKILIVEGLYDKYAISIFCQSSKWADIEVFPSVGASQIADNMSEFSYYKKKDILALFDNDEAGIQAYNDTNKSNALYLNLKDGYFEDNSKSLVMNDYFDSEELKNLSQSLKSKGYETYGEYKETLRILYENKELVNENKKILTKTINNFAQLEEEILEKFGLKSKKTPQK